MRILSDKIQPVADWTFYPLESTATGFWVIGTPAIRGALLMTTRPMAVRTMSITTYSTGPGPASLLNIRSSICFIPTLDG